MLIFKSLVNKLDSQATLQVFCLILKIKKYIYIYIAIFVYFRKKPLKKKIVSSLPDLTKQLNIAAAEGNVTEVSKLLSQGSSFHAYGVGFSSF